MSDQQELTKDLLAVAERMRLKQETTKELLDVVERMRLSEVLYRDPDLVIKAAARIVDLEHQLNELTDCVTIEAPHVLVGIEMRAARIAELESTLQRTTIEGAKVMSDRQESHESKTM